MQCVRDWYSALFSPAYNTMQLFMWQRDIMGVAHHIMECSVVLGAFCDAPDDAPHVHQPWRLDRCDPFYHVR